ncbi:MAG: cellulase family glycosylhydrolase [Bacteroidota bacterium]
MRIRFTLKYILTIGLCLLIFSARAQKKPIALHQKNLHYFTYRGKPTILITSAEHYGAVVNLDFDYITYLDELKSHGLNLTRTFTGAYIEPAGAFSITNNTLAPAAGRLICPWKRSSQTGYAGGGNKFDLNQWDEAYFRRLKDFVAQAQNRGVIVELAFFCPFYDESQWKVSPMNAVNNINNIGNIASKNVYTLDKSGELLNVHDRLVKKIVDEFRNYDNLIYEICNEPYFGGVTMDWQHHIAETIRAAEQGFKYQHLISQNIANNTLKIKDPHPAVSVFNFHYATPPLAVADNYHLNKVIGDNETGFAGNADETYRMQGWLFILAGGSLYNNLDYSFTAEKENGSYQYPATQPGGGSTALRKQLGFLQHFMRSIDFINMQPDLTFVKTAFSKNARVQALVNPGRQYALYLYGEQKKELELELPAGKYQIQWMNTLTGAWEGHHNVSHPGGMLKLPIPVYQSDIAVRIESEK